MIILFTLIQEVLADSSYPLRSSTVPSAVTVAVPLAVAIIAYTATALTRRCSGADIHQMSLGLMYAYVVTGILSNVGKLQVCNCARAMAFAGSTARLKHPVLERKLTRVCVNPQPQYARCTMLLRVSSGQRHVVRNSVRNCIRHTHVTQPDPQVGRPRPSFTGSCFGDAQPLAQVLATAFTAVPHSGVTAATCTNPNSGEVADGWQSFPSGHASYSACGGMFLALFFAHTLRVFSSGRSPALAAVALAPLVFGVWVGLTRISDCAPPFCSVHAPHPVCCVTQ